MKKKELKELGISDEVIRTIQIMHGRDITRERQKIADELGSDKCKKLRTAISSMVEVLEDEISLKNVLFSAIKSFRIENSKAKAIQEKNEGLNKIENVLEEIEEIENAADAENATDGKECI